MKVKRKRELELVMNEIRKLTSESNYTDLENAVNRGLKNIRREKHEEHQINKAKYEAWKTIYRKKKLKEAKRKSDDANAASPC